MFIEKYVSLDLYNEDIKERFIIYHKHIQFDRNNGWALTVIPKKN